MKAPDKIYLLSTPYRFLSFWYDYESPSPDNFKQTEYIRKDALLEWLDGKMTIEGATEGFVGGYDSALKDVIEHINEM